MGSLFSSSRPQIVELVAPTPAPQLPPQQPVIEPLPPVMPTPPARPAPILAPLPPPTPQPLPRLPQKSLQDRIAELEQRQSSAAPRPQTAPTQPPSTQPSAAAPSTGNSNSSEDTASDPDGAQVAGLLDRRRSRFGTILTGSTGVLALNDLVPTRRTLLGE